MEGGSSPDERPYLQASIADLEEAWFHPMGFRLRVASNSHAVIEAAEASFDIFGPAGPSGSADFAFHLYEHEIDDGLSGSPIFRTEGPLVYQTTGRDSILVADREKGFAYGYFGRTTIARPAFFRWHFLDLALFFMLEWRGFLGLHGAAICRNGKALLLRAPSGHGKSTLAYAAARSGLQVLAEDVLWVDVRNDTWWGIPSAFHLLPDAKALFPELSPLEAAVQLNGERKLAIDLRRSWPDSPVTSARPGPVVLLRRAPRAASRLEVLRTEDSYGEWLAGCATKEQDAPDYRDKVHALLRRGVYGLNFGDDIDAALDLLRPLFD